MELKTYNVILKYKKMQFTRVVRSTLAVGMLTIATSMKVGFCRFSCLYVRQKSHGIVQKERQISFVSKSNASDDWMVRMLFTKRPLCRLCPKIELKLRFSGIAFKDMLLTVFNESYYKDHICSSGVRHSVFG